MNQFDANYPTNVTNPNGAGITTAELNEVLAMPAYYSLSRDPVTEVLSGRGILLDGEESPQRPDLSGPASFNADFIRHTVRIVALYGRANAVQAPQLEEVYSDLVEHFLDQNYLPGGAGIGWMGNGYIWRDTGWKSLGMIHKLSEDKRDLYVLSLACISGGSGLADDDASASTDIYLNYFPTLSRSIAFMSDTPAKWQLLMLMRRGMDVSITGKEGNQGNLIPMDGSIIHHGGHHTHYAGYSYGHMLEMHRAWTAAGFSSTFTPSCIARMRRASLAWCFATTGGLNPVHQNMRAALPSATSVGDGGAGNGPGFALTAARLTAAYYGTALASDLEMAHAAIAKTGVGSTALPVEWRTITPPSSPDRNTPAYTANLLGHLAHSTNGTAIQRGPGQWYASLRCGYGQWRGGEAYDAMGLPDHFTSKLMSGSLMLITTGKSGRKPNEVDSGIRYEGWDYGYHPNVTCPDQAPANLLYWKTPAYFGGDVGLIGNSSLRESGMWAGSGATRKSAFFLGDRIVLSTTGVTGANLHTGLIQQAHTTPSAEPLVADGIVYPHNGDWSLSSGGNHKLVDPQGNGYFVHSNPETPGMRLRRGLQKWTYPFGSHYIGSGSAPSFTYPGDFLARMHEFSPTTATYTRVWFDHGATSSNQALTYSVLIKPQAGALDNYAAAMANPATAPVVFIKSEKIHRYWDRATGTTGLAVFDPSESIGTNGVVSVDRSGTYLWRIDGDLMRLSVSGASGTAPFNIRLGGAWSIDSQEDTFNVNATPIGGDTMVSLSYRQASPQTVVLRKQSGTAWATLAATKDIATAHTSFSVNLNAAGIGTSPNYSITTGNGSGLFAISGSNLIANRAFTPADAGTISMTVQVKTGSTVSGTIMVNVTLTDNALTTATADTDGDGFRDAFETASGTNPSSAASKPTTLLAAWWDFNQTQTPYDIIGGVPGKFLNGAGFSASGAGHGGGSGNRSLSLGTSGAAHMATHGSLANLNRMAAMGRVTFSWWQKLGTVSNNFVFFAQSPSSTGQRGFSAHAPANTNIFFDSGGTEATARTLVAQPGGFNWTQWAHLAVVRDGGTAQIWLNGTLLKSETGKIAAKADLTQLLIGSGINGELGLRGEIDDFAFFGAALNSAQIAALASGTAPTSINAPANLPPSISSSTFTVAENLAAGGTVGTLAGTDPEGSSISWSISGTALEDVFGLNPTTGVIALKSGVTLDFETRTGYSLTIVAQDAGGGVVSKVISIKVTNVNEAPVFTANPINKAAGTTGSAYAGTLAGSATDVDAGDSLVYSKVSGPAWLAVASGGALSGTPGAGDVGANSFVVRVADLAGNSVTATLNITVDGALPAGWTAQDIGTVGIAGSSVHSGGTYVIKGSGVGFDGTSDSFRFTWQTMSGDGEIKARLVSMSSSTFDALMIRETTAVGSKFATTGSNSAGGIWWQTRSSTGASVTAGGNGTIPLPCWLRLVRTGDTFVSYRSTDGVTWTQIASRTITMNSQVLVGMAVTSRNNGVLHTATFDNVTVVP